MGRPLNLLLQPLPVWATKGTGRAIPVSSRMLTDRNDQRMTQRHALVRQLNAVVAGSQIATSKHRVIDRVFNLCTRCDFNDFKKIEL